MQKTMIRNKSLFHLSLVCLLTGFACKKDTAGPAAINVVSASGNIANSVDSFRNLLGTILNTGTGHTSGRREINWDGIPDNMVAVDLPSNLFNPTGDQASPMLQRGLMYGGVNANRFRVSNSRFSDLNAMMAGQLTAFSGDKIFASINSGQWEVQFRVAGSDIPAFVKGFGAVFLDVDLPNSTTVEFFDDDLSLGKYFVRPHDETSNFSFLGVQFTGMEKITSVRITHTGVLTGSEPDVSNNGQADLIALDDFLYTEPVAR